MSEIRTLEQLIDALDSDLAWRKRELTSWSSELTRARSVHLEVLLRGAWSMLYAHWEGYTKQSCTAFLEYVSRQGLRIDDLADPIAAIALRSTIGSAAGSTHGSQHSQLVSAIRAGTLKAEIPFDRATIKTFSNLKFDTFREILWSVGCDPSTFSHLEYAIDSLLLKNRNDIAHGKYLLVSASDWEDLRTKVQGALDDVRTQIANAASLKSYLRRSTP